MSESWRMNGADLEQLRKRFEAYSEPIETGFQEGIARVMRQRAEAIEAFLRQQFDNPEEAVKTHRLLTWHHGPDQPGGLLSTETVFVVPEADDRDQWDWDQAIVKYPHIHVRSVDNGLSSRGM
jgi:hypothetical protein